MENKICTKCGLIKPIDEFVKNNSKKDGYGSHCKTCHRKTCSKYYQNNKQIIRRNAKISRQKLLQFINECKSIGCFCCNQKDIACLDFHHIQHKDKGIAQLIKDGNLSKIKEEINKCIVLCANCHRKLHYYNLNLEQVRKSACEASKT